MINLPIFLNGVIRLFLEYCFLRGNCRDGCRCKMCKCVCVFVCVKLTFRILDVPKCILNTFLTPTCFKVSNFSQSQSVLDRRTYWQSSG